MQQNEELISHGISINKALLKKMEALTSIIQLAIGTCINDHKKPIDS